MRVILSPHVDDAALSMGGSLLKWRADGEACVIVNVFTATTFIADHTLPSQEGDPSRLRLDEENLIAAELGVRVVNFDYPDAGLRGYRKLPFFLNQFVRVDWGYDARLIKDVKASLLSTLQQFSNPTLFVPLAPAGHQDHVIVREIGKELSARSGYVNIVFYEDLPYCCHYTLARSLAVRRLQLKSQYVEIKLSDKLELVSRYRHSVKTRWIKEIDRYAKRIGADVPCERFWMSPLVLRKSLVL